MNERRDSGVADLVSASLLTLMTIALMTAATVLILPKTAPEDAAHTRIVAESRGNELRLVHDGGEALPLEVSRIHIVTDTGQEVWDLSDQVAFLGPWWDPGEVICVSGTTGRCADYGGRTITSVQVVREASGVSGAQVTTAWSGSIVGLTPPGPAPDLRLVFERMTPPSPTTGDKLAFTVTVINDGSAATSGPFAIAFSLDGTPQTTVTVGALQVGETATVTSETWLATPGQHDLAVTADAASQVAEEKETNNVALLRFKVVDP